MTGSDDFVRTVIRTLERFTHYDLVLAIIPVAFLVGLLATPLLSMPLEAGIAIAGTVGALAIADALFVNPPSNDV